MTYNEKVQAITDILMKYCEPKPEIDGVLAKDVARMILKMIGERKEETDERDS